MATLTETAYITRKLINLGVITLVLIIILKISFGLASGLWQKLFPPPPPAPTLTFGKLPYPTGQNSVATPSGTITYDLQTADGNLPVFPNLGKVYFFNHPGPTFGSFDKTKAQAAKIGFAGIPVKIGSTAWRFTDTTNPLRTLDIDEISNNFHLVYNYLSDLSLFNAKNFSSEADAISQGQGFFSGLGLLSTDLQSGTPTVAYFKLDSGTLVPTTSLSNADAIGVTLSRGTLDNVPILSPDARQGLVSVLLSGSNDQNKRILEARYFYTPIETDTFATYPLLTATTAYNLLKSGHAIFASLPTPMTNSITIRDISLAYLDPYPPQAYLQPVVVFSDQKGFVAYVPAVDPKWLGQ